MTEYGHIYDRDEQFAHNIAEDCCECHCGPNILRFSTLTGQRYKTAIVSHRILMREYKSNDAFVIFPAGVSGHA